MISLLLSGTARYLLSKYFPLRETLFDSVKKYLDPSRGLSDDDNSTLNGLNLEHTAESRIRSNYPWKITKAEEKVQELICKALLVASDGQTMTGMLCSGALCFLRKCFPSLTSVLGIALIITAMAQQKSLSLYHLAVIYDKINFTM